MSKIVICLKPPFLAALLVVLSSAGCSSTDASIVVTHVRAPGDSCKYDDDTIYIDHGFADLGATAGYAAIYSWKNELQSIPVDVNGQPLSAGSGNDFFATLVRFKYTWSANTAIPDAIYNLSATISAGADTKDNSIGIQMIQPSTVAALQAGLNTGDTQTLLATFHLEGKLRSGSMATSNDVTFPITVTKNPLPPCDLTTSRFTNTCGIIGQDTPVACVPKT